MPYLNNSLHHYPLKPAQILLHSHIWTSLCTHVELFNYNNGETRYTIDKISVLVKVKAIGFWQLFPSHGSIINYKLICKIYNLIVSAYSVLILFI